MRVLVTGVAGFIGYSLTQHLLARGDSVIGIDCVNAYYDVNAEGSAAGPAGRSGRQSLRFLRQDFADYPGLVAALEGWNLTGSSIWARRPGCAIRSKTRMPI